MSLVFEFIKENISAIVPVILWSITLYPIVFLDKPEKREEKSDDKANSENTQKTVKTKFTCPICGTELEKSGK